MKKTNAFLRATFFSVAILLIGNGVGYAQTNSAMPLVAQPLAKDPVLEAKVMEIAKDLRCLVCQNETIAGSHADLAIDLRNQIQEQLEAGATKKAIMQYMVDRYGDFILYNPPFKWSTLVLWGGPFALVVLGLLGLRSYVIKQKKLTEFDLVSSQDLSQARAILESQESFQKDVG